jgi:hypothetical protein
VWKQHLQFPRYLSVPEYGRYEPSLGECVEWKFEGEDLEKKAKIDRRTTMHRSALLDPNSRRWSSTMIRVEGKEASEIVKRCPALIGWLHVDHVQLRYNIF